MLFPNVRNAKVVNNEHKLDRLPCVAPQPRRCQLLVVAGGVQALVEEVVGEFSWLWEAIGVSNDFEKHPSSVDVLWYLSRIPLGILPECHCNQH